MSSSTIFSTIQQIVRHELRSVRVSELAVVEEIAPHRSADDNNNYACDVRLKNSGLLIKGVPVVSGHIGTVAIPNKGDLVLLAFDKGDVNQAFIVGRLYTDGDRPPVSDADEVIFHLPLHASDDEAVKAAIRNHKTDSPPREIIVEMPPKITVRITDGTVRATAGKTEMKLDQSQDSGGTVTVVAGRTTITMNQDGDIAVEAAGAMSLKADGDLSLEGKSVKLSAMTSVDVEAKTQLSLKATTGATVDGGVSAKIQGATVSVSGVTSFGM